MARARTKAEIVNRPECPRSASCALAGRPASTGSRVPTSNAIADSAPVSKKRISLDLVVSCEREEESLLISCLLFPVVCLL